MSLVSLVCLLWFGLSSPAAVGGAPIGFWAWTRVSDKKRAATLARKELGLLMFLPCWCMIFRVRIHEHCLLMVKRGFERVSSQKSQFARVSFHFGHFIKASHMETCGEIFRTRNFSDSLCRSALPCGSGQVAPREGAAQRMIAFPRIVFRLAVVKLVFSFLSAFVTAGMLSAQSDWDDPFPPHRIADHLYYVGSKGLASYLITTTNGHILINSSFERTVPMIRSNVEALGFKFTDIKILLTSHAHSDHASGHALIKQLTGARVEVMQGDAHVIENGGKGQYLYTKDDAWKPCVVDRVLKDGDTVTLGQAKLTALRTPGHTRGCTT